MSRERLIIPGAIDNHVHLREPGATHKEDFESGSLAAIYGGYTTIIDMPNNVESTTSPEALRKKVSLVEGRVYCDVGFYFGATAESGRFFEEVIDEVFGLKIYMNHTTGELLMDRREDLEKVFALWSSDKPILVHAEGETVRTALELAVQHGRRLHVCHVSTEEEILMIREAKQRGERVTCEVTPHHLFLSEEDARVGGPFFVMRPPLASKRDRTALWRNLDIIDTLASDHAPHTREEKMGGGKIPYGVPGLESSLPLMLTAVAEGRLSLDKLVEMTSTNPARIFGISRDPLSYTEIDLKHSYVIEGKNMMSKTGWTPFEGMRVSGRVARVVLRGREVFDGERVVGTPQGRWMAP